MRCRALAAGLQVAGWRCGLATVAETSEFFDDLSAEFAETKMLTGDEPAAMAGQWPGGCDLLVVDHYARDSDFEAACRPWARRILAIDDLADRPHSCDLLLDGTPGRTAAAYGGLVSEECTAMLGADYALLRSEFSIRRRHLLPRATAEPPWRVLLSLGATMDENLAVGIIGGLEATGLELTIDVAIGSASQSVALLRARLDATDGALHIATNEMASLIENADIAIGAAGMSGWERCCLGLPSIVLVLAENQEANAEALAKSGAARVLTGPADTGAIAEAVSDIVGDPAAWRRMSTAAAGMCDGLGLARVVEMIEEPACARDGTPVHLRRVEPDDASIILEWQRHPTTRRFARNPTAPARDEHLAWFGAKRADPKCIFNMITRDREPAGVVRLDRMDDPDAYEVSVLVAPAHRRAGISRAALDLTRRLVPDVDLWAFVKPENTTSLALFRAADYMKSDRPDWYVHSACQDTAGG